MGFSRGSGPLQWWKSRKWWTPGLLSISNCMMFQTIDPLLLFQNGMHPFGKWCSSLKACVWRSQRLLLWSHRVGECGCELSPGVRSTAAVNRQIIWKALVKLSFTVPINYRILSFWQMGLQTRQINHTRVPSPVNEKILSLGIKILPGNRGLSYVRLFYFKKHWIIRQVISFRGTRPFIR